MNSLFYLTLLLTAFCSATAETFKTNNRLVYSSWWTCDACDCHSFSLYAFEHVTQNPSDTLPLVYLYYSHTLYNSCTNTYQSEWFQVPNSLTGLEISRTGRSAELVHNNIDSSNQTVNISLSWSSEDSQNTQNCNCKSIYSYGVESLRVNSKSNYRRAQAIGSVTINGVVHTVPTDSYSYIDSYGQKTVVLQHK